MGRYWIACWIAAAGWIGACSGDPETAAARGERVYRANCVICHSLNPSQPGTVGPAIAGASLPLLEARVLHAAYPPGYTPQRDSHAMPALPFLAEEVPYLAAYLAGSAAGDTRP